VHLQLLSELLSLGLNILDRANHIESGLGERVMGAGKNLLEGPNGIFEGNESAFETGEDLGDLERL